MCGCPSRTHKKHAAPLCARPAAAARAGRGAAPDEWASRCARSRSLAVRDLGSRCYFITAAAAAALTETLTQKPLGETGVGGGGASDSSGIIRINAGTWNKEMSRHNTARLFISILCFARRISRLIMARRGRAPPMFAMVDGCVRALAPRRFFL